MFLPTYSQFRTLLGAEVADIEGSEKTDSYYLENPTINAFIWQRLTQQSNPARKVLQTALGVQISSLIAI